VAENARKKILVADDTRFFCAVLEDLLASEGYDVICAHDGLEALKKVKAELPGLDLLILDLLMPKMTGFDVLREIRKDPEGAKLPVLAITGVFKQSSEIEMLKKLGALGYISKNSSPEEILRRVKFALGEKGVESSEV
jgi:two-component system response regulator VicR